MRSTTETNCGKPQVGPSTHSSGDGISPAAEPRPSTIRQIHRATRQTAAGSSGYLSVKQADTSCRMETSLLRCDCERRIDTTGHTRHRLCHHPSSPQCAGSAPLGAISRSAAVFRLLLPDRRRDRYAYRSHDHHSRSCRNRGDTRIRRLHDVGASRMEERWCRSPVSGRATRSAMEASGLGRAATVRRRYVAR